MMVYLEVIGRDPHDVKLCLVTEESGEQGTLNFFLLLILRKPEASVGDGGGFRELCSLDSSLLFCF